MAIISNSITETVNRVFLKHMYWFEGYCNLDMQQGDTKYCHFLYVRDSRNRENYYRQHKWTL